MTASLGEVLAEARRRGYLGDGPIQRQVAHATGFAAVCRAVLSELAAPDCSGGLLVDLGSGGGIPGLVLVTEADVGLRRTVLLEGSTTRAAFLVQAVRMLGLEARVEVEAARAEVAGRSVAYRGAASVVVARSFGPPAVTAELGAPLLAPGGWLIVSEPPPVVVDATQLPARTGDTDQGHADVGGAAKQDAHPRAETLERWPSDGVNVLGFEPPSAWEALGFHYVALRLARACPERFPRRTGIPEKRPLF